MPLYGGPRDISFKRRVNRSLRNRTIGQEVIYYKLSLAHTEYDVYGDAKTRMYLEPVLLVCSVDRNPQENVDEIYGSDTSRTVDFNFLKDDLIDIQLVPEKGDVIVWNESYYEVDFPIEDQLLVGKDPNYSLQDGLEKFGASWSIICKSHLTRINRLNIIKSR